MLHMMIGFLILLASAAIYLRLQCRALLNWRGIGRALAAAPLIGWIVFFQKAAAASPTSYITPSLLPIDLWGALFNAVIFLLVVEAAVIRRQRYR
ncbi:hypothetical protein [Pedomonas mirosovicensis]|uniref:hypothetical protein n=1 Tax=Pedomonas mirosovicensis TaxID=2908641 RepID=UPI002168623E|nr:hypothetical protein [Pedomonas mirosovicensis]MCH8684925.1 hypothetical protein [Pedomonas mirosovicensis]